MATIQAFIRTTTKKADKTTVRFRLRDGRNVQLFHKSDIEVNPNVWDADKQAIKARVVYDEAERAKFNKSITDRKDLILKAYSVAEDKDNLTSKWLESEIDKLLHPEKYKPIDEKPATLFQYLNKFIEIAPQRKDKATGRLLSYNNIQQYRATQKHLLAFAEIKRKKDFEFHQINQKFYADFVDYLQSEIPERDSEGNITVDNEGNPKLLKESFTANSVGKHIRVLKLILNEATREGINTSTAYNNFHVLTEETDTVYLNEIELQKIKETNFSQTPYLDRVRDWFLLLAWTGCRFSDLEKVSKTDIKDGYITFRQQKTNTKVTIPLHPVVLEILTKYDFNLPEPISNQRFNEYIKEVVKLSGIDSTETITRTVGGILQNESKPKYQLVSSHTGRRSFCTNMYKRGLSTLMIMSISGHKTEKSFLKYIKVKQEEHAEMMAKVWAKIYQ